MLNAVRILNLISIEIFLILKFLSESNKFNYICTYLCHVLTVNATIISSVMINAEKLMATI